MTAGRVEDVIFEGLVADDEYCRKVLHHIKPDFFQDRVDQILIEEIGRFYHEHNKAPTKKILKLFLEDFSGFKEEEYRKANDVIDRWTKPEENIDWLIKRTEQFCQEKAVYNAIMQSIHIIDGKNSTYGKDAIPKILSDALAVSFDKTIGHDYFDEIDRRYDFYHLKEDRIPFDLTIFNKVTKGGVPRKTLNLVLAGPNVGKSLFLCHHAAAAMKLGYNVLYITMEMAEERIAERIDCNLMGITLDQLYRSDKQTFQSNVNAIKSKTNGRLVIKEYPTGSAHVGHFESLMDELKLKKNFVPDIVYIDYLNICASQKYKGGNSWNSYFAIKAVAEELRALAVKYNVPVFSATQVNRGGMNSTEIEMSDVSESAGVAMTVDYMFALIRTEETDKVGQLVVKQLKSRYNDVNYYKRFLLNIDLHRFTLSDGPDEYLADNGHRQDNGPDKPLNTVGVLPASFTGGRFDELDFD